MSERLDHVQEERDIRLVSWGIRGGEGVILGVPAVLLARAVPGDWWARAAVDWFPLGVVLVLAGVGMALGYALARRVPGWPRGPR